MMGTRHRIADGNTLRFDIRGSKKFNRVRVTLTPLDTYTVEFIKCSRFDIIRQEEVTDIYADQLHDVIEQHTGLALSL